MPARPFEVENSRWWTAPRNAVVVAAVIGLYVATVCYFAPPCGGWKPGECAWIDVPRRDPTLEKHAGSASC